MGASQYRSRLAPWLVSLAMGLSPGFSSAQGASAKVFSQHCVACHGDKGQGVVGLAPALAGPLKPVLAQALGRDYVSQVLVYGLSGRIVSQGQTFVGAMPNQGALSDAELSDVANYLAQELNGLQGPLFQPEHFERVRALKPVPTHKDLRAIRAQVWP